MSDLMGARNAYMSLMHFSLNQYIPIAVMVIKFSHFSPVTQTGVVF